MAPVTLSFIYAAVLITLATIGYVHLMSQLYNTLAPYYDKFHAYVLKKGWL